MSHQKPHCTPGRDTLWAPCSGPINRKRQKKGGKRQLMQQPQRKRPPHANLTALPTKQTSEEDMGAGCCSDLPKLTFPGHRHREP